MTNRVFEPPWGVRATTHPAPKHPNHPSQALQLVLLWVAVLKLLPALVLVQLALLQQQKPVQTHATHAVCVCGWGRLGRGGGMESDEIVHEERKGRTGR